MTRARAGLGRFLSRRAAPPRETIVTLQLPDGPFPLRIRRHPTATRLTLRLAPDGSEARMSIPAWAPVSDARDFAHSRREWIAAQRAIVPIRMPIADGAMLPYRGITHRIDHRPDLPRRPQVVEGRIEAGGPVSGLGPRLRRWLEGDAIARIEDDVARYCGAASVPVPTVRLSRAQRRWGSCASDGTVRINWRLIMAPDAVRRSVAAHEVAHLVHFDHSPAFHDMLRGIYDDDLDRANAWLKRHGRTLYAPFG